MKNQLTLAALIAAALTSGAAMAQETNKTATATPGASAPSSRAEVKAEGAANMKAVPQSESGGVKTQMNQPRPTANAREDVKAEGKAALRAGEVPQGESGMTKSQRTKPSKGTSETTRSDVKAETSAESTNMRADKSAAKPTEGSGDGSKKP